MTNEEYGITAIKLIFSIIILVVIISGIVFIVKRLWQDTSIKNIETDLLYIKAKCKVIHDKNIIDKNEQLLGEKITEYTENEEINTIISQSDKWYKLSQEDLETIGMENLKFEDGYLVNYEENDIIYAKGIEENEQIYYKLSDLEAQREKEKAQEQEEEQPSIESEDSEQPSKNQETQEEPSPEQTSSEEPPLEEVKAEATPLDSISE